METYFGRWNIYLGRTLWYAPSFSKMKRILTYIIPAIVLFILAPSRVRATEVTASATIRTNTPISQSEYDYRVQNLKNFLAKFSSPLVPYAQDFVSYADANGLDYRLVPSITGVESTFGKQIPYKSYNAYGWVNGNFSFKSWPDSISVVSSTLKNNYIDRGVTSISEIAHVYAPPSSTWGSKVKYFVSKIDTLPLNFDLSS